MFLNHSIVLAELFHWLTCNNLTKCWLMFSKIDLLTLPSSLLEGFIRRQCKLDWKLSLWSFKVIKAGVLARHSILSLSWIFYAMFFASILIANVEPRILYDGEYCKMANVEPRILYTNTLPRDRRWFQTGFLQPPSVI